MVRASLIRCSCISHNCHRNTLGYTELPRPIQQKHREDSDDLEVSLRRLSISAHTNCDVPASPVSPAESDKTRILMLQFKSILDEYQVRMQTFRNLAEKLEKQPEYVSKRDSQTQLEIRSQISWMTATMCNLQALSTGADIGLDQQRSTMVQILQGTLKDIQSWEESRYDAVTDGNKVEQVGEFVAENENLSRHHLASSHPLVLLSMFIALVLNVIHELPERSSNFLLQMHRDLLKLAFQTWGDKDFTDDRLSIVKRLLKDIRTVRSRFGLDRQIHVFAACPNCSALSEPTYDTTWGFNIYPSIYCNQMNLKGEECGATLLKWQVRGNQTIRVPIRPYGYFSLRNFVGEMLNRPGYEDLLERRPSATPPDTLSDIFDGSIIRDFKGPDGHPYFLRNGLDSDLYLAWAICVDWYNPYHNKIAGKLVSVGVISMICLNLPLHMWIEVSNIYLAGIIPGPREPSLHAVNNFLSPIIDDLLESWHKGLHYSQTYKHFNGRTVHCALIPLVADLPASRKVSGTTGHGSNCFCSLCLLKKKDIDNISVSFKKRTKEEHVDLAKQWRDAKSETQRVALAKKNGVRYSVLLDLPYWEPRFIVVDAMHNLFLGLIKHHFREVIGIEYEKSSRDKGKNSNASRHELKIAPKKISKILGLLKDPQKRSASRLRRYTINELTDFHICQRIPLPLRRDNNPYRKAVLVSSLLGCYLTQDDSKTESSRQEDASEEDALDEDLMPFYLLDDVSLYYYERKADRRVVTRFIRSREINAIQAAILLTSRPSWQQSPPKAFGTSQSGKLKADQWRTLMEFDLPVALVELWIDSDDPSSGTDFELNEKRRTLVDLTMELAAAVFWGTSKRTSADHTAKYLMHMQRYLGGLQKLSPKPKLVANHHAALHIGEQLLFFGPVNGWWTYPYERLIGVLQNINTNFVIGEMELTILKSYHANAHLQQFLERKECPTLLRNHVPTLEKYYPALKSGSFTSKFQRGDSDKTSKHIEQLDDDIYDCVCLLKRGERKPSRKFMVHVSHVVGESRYTTIESERDSIIFYGSDKGRCPGFIRKIFSLADGVVLFAIHPYLKVERRDPFKQYPEYRASLWSQRVDEQVQLINPNTTYICHAARRPWKDEKAYVFRPLDRNY